MNLEEALLPHLCDNESIEKLWKGGVREEHLEDFNVQDIFKFSLEYYLKSGFTHSVTKDLLEDKFSFYFKQEERWNQEPILVDFIVEELLVRYKKNSLDDVLLESAKASQKDPSEALQVAIEGLTKIQRSTSPRDRHEDYAERYEARISDYVEGVLEKMTRVPGIPLGWDEITNHIYGIHPGELGLIAGYTGAGKSWFGFQTALKAVRSGYKVYLASLELDSQLTMNRLDCLVSGVPFRKYERGQLTTKEIELLKSAREEVESLKGKLLIDFATRPQERTVTELYSRAKQFGADLLVGDQLSWVTPVNTYSSGNYDTLQMGEVITDIAYTNKETKLASLWLVQFNREMMTSQSGKGGLQNIALSSKIEQIVDIAFGIATSKEHELNEMLVLDLLKCRRSKKESWLMEWKLEDETKLAVMRKYTDNASGFTAPTP